MKFFLVAFLLLMSSPAQAFLAVSVEPAQPFEPVVLEQPDAELKQVFLGDLEGYPDMLEFSVFSTTSIALSLWQRPVEPVVPFGVIVVRVNENGRGVTEVARAHQEKVVWQEETIPSLGRVLTTSEPLTLDLSAGQYRVEVSTPQNVGAYTLRFADTDAGYFATLGSVYQTLRHFSYNPFSIVQSPYVYYPLGLLIVIIGIAFTVRYHRRLTKHAS